MANRGSGAHKNDNVAAGDMIPPMPKINSLQAIMRLRPKTGAEWSTIAFVLNRDMIKSDGTLDDLHAVIFPLGSFSTQELAEEHAKNIISMTGHPAVIAARYGAPVKLTTKFDPETVVQVPVDTRGRILQLESAQYRQEREEYERRLKIERDVMKEAEEETDPDSIEHFKRQCYLAIKNRAAYQMHSKEADTAWESYKKREMEVRDHFRRHPEHEVNWLPYLKEKLIERGELNLYHAMENAYKEIRDELLGLIESDDDDETTTITPASEVIKCECPGDVCLGLKSDKSGSSGDNEEECPGGVCMASRPNEDDDMIASEDVQDSTANNAPSESFDYVEESDDECPGGVCMASQKNEDDEMIAPEDIQSSDKTNENSKKASSGSKTRKSKGKKKRGGRR